MFRMRFEFKPEDQWIGRFYRKTNWVLVYDPPPLKEGEGRKRGGHYGVARRDEWWCLIPGLPLHLVWHEEPLKETAPVSEKDFWAGKNQGEIPE